MATRRTFLRSSAVLGVGLATGPSVARPTDPVPLRASGVDGYACDLTALAAASAQTETIAVTPFVLPFRQPPRATVRTDAAGDHVRIVARPADVQVLPPADGPATRVWGYDASYPGPTIVARRGVPTSVTQVNGLAAPMTVHLHGGHVPPEMDGHPNDLIAPGAEKTYVYPNTQPTATLWYHDHAHHRTAETVYRGLAGIYLLEDPAEEALGLPAGDRDVVLLLQDRTFGADGSLVYDARGHMGFLGRTHLVNGIPHPVMTVDRTRYRLRLVNGANARRYVLAFSDGRPFQQIATDGGLLDRPVTRTSLALSPAERAEIVVDLSDLAAGDTLYLRDQLDELTGRADETRIIRFDAGDAASASRPVPAELRPLPAIGAATATRDVHLDLVDGVWLLDRKPYDPARIDAFPRFGAVERWRFTNPSPLVHPMHLHLVMFQVESRNGVPAGDEDRGWKDTVAVLPGETVSVLARFDGYRGTYVYHCHNLEHEDHDMMAQLKVVDLARLAGDSRTATAVALARHRFPEGAARLYVATAGDFPDALAAAPYALRDGAPILLTGADALPREVSDEIRRLAPAEAVVVGGPRVVSDTVVAELRRLVPSVRRIAGTSRAATAAALAADRVPGATTAYLATGRAFPDALSAGVGAAAEGAALLLVEPDHVPDETRRALEGIEHALLLGGPAAVSRAVEDEVRRLVTRVDRVAGTDRYDTSARLVQRAFPGTAREVWVATGAAFPDALAGVPAAGGAPVLLVAPDRLAPGTVTALERLAPERIVIVGGPNAVSAAVESELAHLLPG